jgi:hypothetical protein
VIVKQYTLMGKMRGGPRKAQLKYSRKKKKDKAKY